MAERDNNERGNGKLSLHPLKFEEAVKELVKVKPLTKKSSIRMTGDK